MSQPQGPYGHPQGGPPMQGFGSHPQQQMMQKPPAKSNAAITCVIILVCLVPVLGVVAALGIYGVRRYLVSAKTAEAKNSLGAIARAHVGAYEASETLCGPAPPVPADVPSGRKYQPSTTPGLDFEQGSPSAGWKCLKFSVSHPIYFRYEVRAGSGYKGPARGGPDPGPDGFEISAEGDLDGDGLTSLFVQTGKVDKVAKQVTLSPQIFIVDEYE